MKVSPGAQGRRPSFLGAMRNQANLVLERFGFRLVRWPSEVPESMALRVFQRKLTTVFDVGANVGAFGIALRRNGFSGQIFSFEAIPEVFQVLEKRSSGDRLWSAFNVALGARPERKAFHVASNFGASSSFLEFTQAHLLAAPDVRITETREFEIQTLDALSSNLLSGGDVCGLKLDVQGFEKEVLEGGQSLLAIARAVWIEVSIEPLYDGSWTALEAVHYLEEKGFRLSAVVPGFHSEQGTMHQFDAIFLRG